MKKLSVLVAATLLILNTAFAQGQTKDEQAIRQVLNTQVEQWNTGNIDAFMKGYWQSDSLLFIGKNGPKYGYKATLENYKKNYIDTTAMGKLSFNILQVRRLSSDYSFVVGKWHLQRTIGDLQGHFTLLFRKIKGEWVIVADHSS